VSTIFAGAIPTNEGNFGGVTGLDFTVNHTGTVDALWWYQPTGSAAAVTPGLYNTETQALLATAPAAVGLPAGAWSSIPLAAPVALVPGTIYTAACYQNNRIAWYAGMLNNAYRFASPFTVIQGAGRVQGAGALQFPGTFFDDAYAVDVNFTATEPCEPCAPCPPTEGFFINLTSPGFVNVVTGVGGCVIEALGQTPAGAPCRQCLLLPTQQIPWDNCGPCPPAANGCNGQVALAIREVYGSKQFPQPANGASWRKCQHYYDIARVVVSVTRCVPTMDSKGIPPGCPAELAAAIILENDRTAVRQAIACCLTEANRVTPWLVSEWLINGSVTVGELGACAGTETEFLIGVRSCLCSD
jgi:hypothetical protein